MRVKRRLCGNILSYVNVSPRQVFHWRLGAFSGINQWPPNKTQLKTGHTHFEHGKIIIKNTSILLHNTTDTSEHSDISPTGDKDK